MMKFLEIPRSTISHKGEHAEMKNANKKLFPF